MDHQDKTYLKGGFLDIDELFKQPSTHTPERRTPNRLINIFLTGKPTSEPTRKTDNLIRLYPNVYQPKSLLSIPDSWFQNLENLSKKIAAQMSRHQDFKIKVYEVSEQHNQLKFYFSISGPKHNYDQLNHQIKKLIKKANSQIQNTEDR